MTPLSEHDAYLFLEELRWAKGIECPLCGHPGADYIMPTNGISRGTRTRGMSQRRVWRCHGCRRQFSVLTRSPLHGSKVPLVILVAVLTDPERVSIRKTAAKFGVSESTACNVLRLVHLIEGSAVPTSHVDRDHKVGAQ